MSKSVQMSEIFFYQEKECKTSITSIIKSNSFSQLMLTFVSNFFNGIGGISSCYTEQFKTNNCNIIEIKSSLFISIPPRFPFYILRIVKIFTVVTLLKEKMCQAPPMLQREATVAFQFLLFFALKLTSILLDKIFTTNVRDICLRCETDLSQFHFCFLCIL